MSRWGSNKKTCPIIVVEWSGKLKNTLCSGHNLWSYLILTFIFMIYDIDPDYYLCWMFIFVLTVWLEVEWYPFVIIIPSVGWGVGCFPHFIRYIVLALLSISLWLIFNFSDSAMICLSRFIVLPLLAISLFSPSISIIGFDTVSVYQLQYHTQG